jgi:hypothetical protein
MNTTEQYECGNCYFVGELDVHGGCGRCHSQAVLSVEKVRELFTREIMLMDQRRVLAATLSGARQRVRRTAVNSRASRRSDNSSARIERLRQAETLANAPDHL